MAILLSALPLWSYFCLFWLAFLGYTHLAEPRYPLWACYVIQTINWIIIVLNIIVIPVLTVTVFRPFLTSVN
ncbi:TPA: hypothetical protein SI523_002878 [Escherichia coli]|nr:hypothetical protein [Escherichia coli]HEI2460555.1 hypothetical protein [Escherichia coli]HEI2666405.1 hypothetical protein [Escherichia coli]HEI3925223.1 hypothetical protein [Escherichia coli]